MGGMILNPEHVLDHVSDPCRGPDIAAKAEGFGPFRQFVGQLRHLLFGQFWFCPRWRLMPQGLDSLRSRLFEPLAHCSLAHAEGFGYVFLFPSSFLQFLRTHASGFAPVCWRCGLCAHTSFYRPVWPLLYFSLLRSIGRGISESATDKRAISR